MSQRTTCGIAYLLATVLSTAWATAQDKRPPPADHPVDFHKEIVSILANSCAKCHSSGKRKGDFSFDTRESLLAGGKTGPAVVVGKSGESLLVDLVAGVDPKKIMPKQGPRLTATQVGLLRAWIDQGLNWEEGFTFKKAESAPLEPRRPALPAAPAGSELTNPIDLLLAPYFAGHKETVGKLVDDRAYIRRVYLDTIGLFPSPDEIRQFVDDSQADKRLKLVQRLLAEKRRYAEHWLTFWNDALRNDYRGTGYIDGGRQQITEWLYGALAENMPYDEFVRELISPGPQSEGFVKGIVWRGVVNASQVPQVQAAQNVSQVFLGINLKCASCHDSFINDWKLADSYGLASIFSDGPLEMHRCDKPTGQFAEMKFLYPELGTIDPKAPRPERLKQLAAVITSQRNGRLARTIVNRMWAKLFGRGLVEPVDDMDAGAWSPEVLDWLAVDLADHKYDLKHTLEIMLTSRAYQLAAVGMSERDREGFVFQGPVARRMSAEQFVDAVATVASVSYLEAAFNPPAAASEGSTETPGKPNRVAVRAALANADPLMAALGRPNREQVVTERPKVATTLQALEMTNGATLAGLLQAGAKKWIADSALAGNAQLSAEKLVERLYNQAIGRDPTQNELAMAIEIVGSPPAGEGVEDLMWVLIMLPEFQLIR